MTSPYSTHSPEIQTALDTVNEAIAIHGGVCKVVAVEGDTMVVQLIGGCAGCPSARMTLYHIVGPTLTSALPWLETVLLDLGGEEHAQYC